MIAVSVFKEYTEISFSSAAIQRTAEYVCRSEGVKIAELSFVIVDDGTMRAMNKKFLKHNYITDVITFPLEQKGVNAEIYIDAQQAKRQAKEHAVTVKNEMMRLVVHGTLHAIGYRDTTKGSKKRMDSIQERYVSELNVKK